MGRSNIVPFRSLMKIIAGLEENRCFRIALFILFYSILYSFGRPESANLEIVPIWFPAIGISVLFLHHFGLNYWVLVYLSSLCILVIKRQIPFQTGNIIAFSDTVESITAAYLLRSYCAIEEILTFPMQLIKMILISGVCAVLGALLGVMGLWRGGYPFSILEGISQWAIGDLLGIMVVAFVYASAVGVKELRKVRDAQTTKFDLLGLTFSVAITVQFLTSGYSLTIYLCLAMLLLPARLLIALRGSQFVLTLLDVFAVGIAVFGYHFHLGIFAIDHVLHLYPSAQLFNLINIFFSRLVMAQSFENRRVMSECIRTAAEQRGAEERVRQTRALLEQGVKVAQIGMFEHDLSKEDIEWSNEMRQIWGWNSDDKVTIRGFLKYVYPGDLSEVERAIHRSLLPSGDGSLNIEHRIITPAGEIRWISVKGQTTFSEVDGERKAVHTLGAVVDITKVKEKEEIFLQNQTKLAELAQSLSEKNRLLENVNQELKQFTAVAAHDLRAPLRSTQSWVELLGRYVEKQQDEKIGEAIHFIKENSKKADSLIEDLLELSRVTALAALPASRINLGQVVKGILENLKDEIEASEARIYIGDLPVVMGNLRIWEMIWEHLLRNAFAYRKRDRPCEINVNWIEKEGFYEFCIRDNGIGIESRYIDRIFEMFTRLHGPEIPGTGIGLAVCKKIIEMYGGKMSVVSVPGHGASFSFSYPKTPHLNSLLVGQPATLISVIDFDKRSIQ